MKIPNKIKMLFLMLILALFLSSCSGYEILFSQIQEFGDAKIAEDNAFTPTPAPTLSPQVMGSLETIQDGFSGVYGQVLPSVVNIQVVRNISSSTPQDKDSFPFPLPYSPFEGGEVPRSGLGSGFIWDNQGHIVTNNHVVENADLITVTFHDGVSVEAELVGADADSDLAVIKVDYPEELLKPIQIADSTQAEVGQLVAAIGNPFGLQGTMTVGIISALGRSLPVGDRILSGSRYTIPDIIQTDAPINPGNSGGVLVDIHGELIGVPTAIESSSGVNAGIGFVVPSVIVQRVVPELIEEGYFEHAWIGFSGITLTSQIAEEMNLPREQRGILVLEVVPDSPADDAGLVGSDRIAQINGQEFRIGGDIITAIENNRVLDFEDLTTYLARYSKAGETVTVTLVRDKGDQEELEIKLGKRPSSSIQDEPEVDEKQGKVWLGILGVSVTSEIAEAMNLPEDQTGILVQQVVENSPADSAGLRGSYKPFIIQGQQVLLGGDIITAVDGVEIQDQSDLRRELRLHEPGDEILVDVIRDGEDIEISVTLAEKP